MIQNCPTSILSKQKEELRLRAKAVSLLFTTRSEQFRFSSLTVSPSQDPAVPQAHEVPSFPPFVPPFLFVHRLLTWNVKAKHKQQKEEEVEKQPTSKQDLPPLDEKEAKRQQNLAMFERAIKNNKAKPNGFPFHLLLCFLFLKIHSLYGFENHHHSLTELLTVLGFKEDQVKSGRIAKGKEKRKSIGMEFASVEFAAKKVPTESKKKKPPPFGQWAYVPHASEYLLTCVLSDASLEFFQKGKLQTHHIMAEGFYDTCPANSTYALLAPPFMLSLF